MKNSKFLKLLLSLALLVLSSLVVSYFWKVETFMEIAQVPISLMILCLCYVLVQILKRFIFKSQNWWDWLYYIGLLSVMIPTYMINEENQSMFINLAKYGTTFLVIPVLFDVYDLIQKKKA